MPKKEFKRDDPEELKAIEQWGIKRGMKCGHQTPRAVEVFPINSSNTSVGGFHPSWNAQVTVICRTCGDKTMHHWIRNQHAEQTFGKK